MRGYFCILVLGLSTFINAAELPRANEESDSKDISFKEESISGSSNGEKIKRGVVKISNSDNPGFNHLSSSSYSSSTSSSSSSSGFKPSSPPNVPPFRYIQSNPQQSLVSSAYLQPAHSAAQIASQYSLQASPLTNYYQSPAQLQYVSTPTVPQAPFIKFQGFGGGYSAGNSVADATSSSSSAQYSSQSHKGLTSGSQLSAASISTKELPLYQTSLPFYYAQQPFVTFFVQPQTGTPNFFYQHPGLNYFFKHQPQQYLGYQGLKGLGVYPSAYANQVTYLVPMAVTSVKQDGGLTNDLKASTNNKVYGSALYPSSSASFTYGNKG